MLKNEKYIGDALLQKTYMADLFTHEQRKNMGELPKYYVHDAHPAIIDRDTFQRVQEEIARRSSLRKTSSPNFEQEYWFKRRTRQMFRVKGVSWWPEELPLDAEYEEAIRNLEKADWRVDCILTHCAPTSIQEKLDGNYTPDQLTDFLQMIKRRCQFDHWFLGHYHRNCIVDDRFVIQWEQMVELQWE